MIHSGLPHHACPMKGVVGSANRKPAAAAWAAVVALSRSAVALSFVSSLELNHVSALQSWPLKMRG